MIRRGWIVKGVSKTQQVLEALKFFGVASPDAWRAIWESEIVAYRKSAIFKSDFGAITAWLRQGELEAQKIECNVYNAETFRNVLNYVRELTVKPVNVFQEELVRLCATAGVAVVFVQELPKISICGATQWLTPGKALIQLSLRYKCDDQLWFTFFHEAGHILLHGKRQFFLETDEKDRKGDEEEADTFATNMLINQSQWREFIASHSYRTKVAIKKFADTVGIAPGIVVGRLQHEKLLPHSHCNELKRHLEWDTEGLANSYVK